MTGIITNPAKTYTLDQFISMKNNDELTYKNFSILEVVNNIEFLDHNIIEDYIDELKSISVDVTLEHDEYVKYKYCPDLLAYDVYGSVQLDFVIMFINDIIDPKDFNKRTIKLPYASSVFKDILNRIYNAEANYINYNRYLNGLKTNIH